jgi:hypothetical protein
MTARGTSTTPLPAQETACAIAVSCPERSDATSRTTSRSAGVAIDSLSSPRPAPASSRMMNAAARTHTRALVIDPPAGCSGSLP